MDKGWGWPGDSRKAHYFVEDNATRSLCGKWGFFCGRRDAATHLVTRDKCASCRRRLAKRAPESEEPSDTGEGDLAGTTCRRCWKPVVIPGATHCGPMCAAREESDTHPESEADDGE